MTKKEPLKGAMKVSLTFYTPWSDQFQLVATEVFKGDVSRCVEELAKTSLFNLIQNAKKLQAEAEAKQGVIDVKPLAENKGETIVEVADKDVPNTVLGSGQESEQPKSDGLST
jgi:hypothetical protein